MDYKKPQDTLVHGGIGLYPLTTADQIILADGGRLEKAGKINADKLGGRTLAEIMLEIYPVGAIYISTSSTSPASLFGGTWEQLKDRFLLGAGGSYSAGGTGGEATHKLTANEMPSHKHYYKRQNWFSSDTVYDSSSGSIYSWRSTAGGTTSSSYRGEVEATGGGNAHNNMPPYLAVYMWKRVN